MSSPSQAPWRVALIPVGCQHVPSPVVAQWRALPPADFVTVQQTDAASLHDRRLDALILFAESATPELRALLRDLRTRQPALPVLLLLTTACWEHLHTLDATRLDFAGVPLGDCELRLRLTRLLPPRQRPEEVMARLHQRLSAASLVGESASFCAAAGMVLRFSQCESTVLLLGETGTGKEMFARAIHNHSRRADRPFVAVNVGALPETLIEAELFGHQKGSFTGANADAPGLIRQAEGGTLFLDDIDNISPHAQIALLRFLQDREFRAVGSVKPGRADVRVISASNASLHRAVENRSMRSDFFYRISVLSLQIPPLREREHDALLLARHFLTQHAADADTEPPVLQDSAAMRILAHRWPGNVRELQHAIERGFVLARGRSTLEASDLQIDDENPHPPSFKDAKSRAITDFERTYLANALRLCGGNVTRAAAVAQKNRRAFWELLRKYRIDARSYGSSTSLAAMASVIR